MNISAKQNGVALIRFQNPKKINDFIRMKKFNDKVDEWPTFCANLCKLNQLIEKVKNELC